MKAWYRLRMKRGKMFFQILLAGICILLPHSLFAHPLDVAYFDVSQTATATTLTVAVHPYQAFELIRAGKKIPFNLEQLRERQDLIAAYIADHVQLEKQGGGHCLWEPESANVPKTELDAVADGVTITAVIQCNLEKAALLLTTDIFVDGFPGQSNIVRIEKPDGFVELGKIDNRNNQFTITNIYDGQNMSQQIDSSQSVIQSSRITSDFGNIAKRLLDPGLGKNGFMFLLLSAVFIGALHALGPGHGKSLMAAMLIGEQATFRRVIALGTVMTVTHVADVFLLAMFAGFISAFLPPTSIIKWLEIFSAAGLIIFGSIRVYNAVKQYRQAKHNPNQIIADEAHERAHQLGMPQSGSSFSKTLWLGFIGSLAPCPTAWAIFMGTISIGKAVAGLALLISFTIGLHITILLIGFLIISSTNFASKRTPIRLTYFLPIISASIITILGVYLLMRNIGMI
ncbi:sulfite exporter TauE/SafE family protein [Candidatus Uhrbacteria bacterium]|nr:sulfite exporter TauE/SafE family protein [Candidatus Uhrbacteria bacterium]